MFALICDVVRGPMPVPVDGCEQVEIAAEVFMGEVLQTYASMAYAQAASASVEASGAEDGHDDAPLASPAQLQVAAGAANPKGRPPWLRLPHRRIRGVLGSEDPGDGLARAGCGDRVKTLGRMHGGDTSTPHGESSLVGHCLTPSLVHTTPSMIVQTTLVAMGLVERRACGWWSGSWGKENTFSKPVSLNGWALRPTCPQLIVAATRLHFCRSGE